MRIASFGPNDLREMGMRLANFLVVAFIGLFGCVWASGGVTMPGVENHEHAEAYPNPRILKLGADALREATQIVVAKGNPPACKYEAVVDKDGLAEFSRLKAQHIRAVIHTEDKSDSWEGIHVLLYSETMSTSSQGFSLDFRRKRGKCERMFIARIPVLTGGE